MNSWETDEWRRGYEDAKAEVYDSPFLDDAVKNRLWNAGQESYDADKSEEYYSRKYCF